MTTLITISDLTRAEKLIIARRRDEISQPRAAARHGVSIDTYKRWETGRYKGPVVALGALAKHEECFVLRRRANMSRSALARRLGVSLTWVTQLERGRAPVDRLYTYWSTRTREGRRRSRA
jgi:DNA-binding transcriptional regulator YiaG